MRRHWDEIERAPPRPLDRQEVASARARPDRNDGRGPDHAKRGAGLPRRGSPARDDVRSAGRQLAGFSASAGGGGAGAQALPLRAALQCAGAGARADRRRSASSRTCSPPIATIRRCCPTTGVAQRGRDQQAAHYRRFHRRNDRPLRGRPSRGAGRTGRSARPLLMGRWGPRPRVAHREADPSIVTWSWWDPPPRCRVGGGGPLKV